MRDWTPGWAMVPVLVASEGVELRVSGYGRQEVGGERGRPSEQVGGAVYELRAGSSDEKAGCTFDGCVDARLVTRARTVMDELGWPAGEVTVVRGARSRGVSVVGG